MRNLNQLLLQENGIEARHLFRLWEKLQLRASKYKNHRIFTLRCIHNDLIPVSIKLKSTLKSARANRILRKAEKDLLQTRVKSINYILDKTAQQLEECRSKLATIISTQKLRECQDFVDKVGEIRFNKVKLRQLNKFNLLTIRKEGNITRSNNTNTNNLVSLNQTNSQVNPPYQGRNHSFPGKYPPQATAITPGEGTIPSQASTPLPEKLVHLRQPLSLPEKLALPWQPLSLLEKLVLPWHLSLPGKLVPLWLPPRLLLSLP